MDDVTRGSGVAAAHVARVGRAGLLRESGVISIHVDSARLRGRDPEALLYEQVHVYLSELEPVRALKRRGIAQVAV